MPIEFGVLKCRAVDRRLGTKDNAHYQIHALANEESFRIAINVQSKLSPSELLYFTNENFQHEVTRLLIELPTGYTPLKGEPDGMALDYIRSNLFDRNQLVPLAFDIPGKDNDLNEKIDQYIKRAIASEDGVIYAFGEIWGPENKRDKIFDFLPGRGIHNIHMNQGNAGIFKKDDGVYQDGALLIHYPSENKWTAIFLAFQSQSWHTDDHTGHTLGNIPIDSDVPQGATDAFEGAIFIAGAIVKSGQDDEAAEESVTLLNATDRPIDLTGWSIANKAKRKFLLEQIILPGQYLTIPILREVAGGEFLRNKGDNITLLNADGLKIHGVSYTQRQVRSGWTIKF